MDRIKRVLKWLIRQRWWWPVLVLFVLSLLLQALPVSSSRDVRLPQRLKARKSLFIGQAVDRNDFELSTDPSSFEREVYVDDQSLSDLIPSHYRNNLLPGDLLKWRDLEINSSRREIPPGHRAYVILPENPWLARSGDRIDILVRPQDGRTDPIVVAENVTVLERLGRGTKGEVVIALRQRDLELLEKAKQQGKLSIAVLGKSDFASQRQNTSRRNRRTVRRVKKIEIINGAE